MSGRGGNNALLDGGGGCYYGDCVMKMITDLQFGKVREALTSSGYDAKMEDEKKEKKNDVAELVWWFLKSSEQYRVRGHLRFVGVRGNTATSPADTLKGSGGGSGATCQTWRGSSSTGAILVWRTPVSRTCRPADEATTGRYCPPRTTSC
jgi:hypothetical protein